MSPTNPSVDGFLRKSAQWREELQALRSIVLGCGLTEEVKWRVPCYTHQGRNILFLGRLKDSCVISFIRGALLADPEGLLVQQTVNSQSVRVIRFTDVGAIADRRAALAALVTAAVEVERAGLKVALKRTADFEVPDEFQDRLDRQPTLRAAFAALTPGRQRGYLLFFAGAKQSKTRAARVDRSVQRILDGKGPDDD